MMLVDMSSWCEIFDPRSKFINRCNHFLLIIGIFNLYIDALFPYVADVNDRDVVSLNLQFGIIISFLRMMGDFSLFLGIILKFRTAISTFHSLSVNKELLKEPRIIAINYLKSSFIIDLMATLPLPQAYLWYCIVALKSYEASDVYLDLTWITGIQYFPRFISTFTVYRKIEKVFGMAMRNPWAGTLFALFVYTLLSHHLGAVFYRMYMDEILYCRYRVIRETPNATKHDLGQHIANCTRENESEPGLSLDAFTNNIGSRSFTQKYMFCFSWGLKTLSSMGQNLTPNAYIVDSICNITIVILGLMVFADVIARMQTSMQSVDESEQQQMIQQRELEEWTKLHQLPPHLKKRVRENMQTHFTATRSVDSEAMLDSLPRDLSCQIRRHLYLAPARNLPVFHDMDYQVLLAICGHLKTFTGFEGMFIALEGDPVRQLLFISTGKLEIFSVDDQSSSSHIVGPGELCGQELLEWASLPGTSTLNLPSSSCTVKCLTDVEAFSIQAKDLKLMAIEFNYDRNFFDAISRHSPNNMLCI